MSADVHVSGFCSEAGCDGGPGCPWSVPDPDLSPQSAALGPGWDGWDEDSATLARTLPGSGALDCGCMLDADLCRQHAGDDHPELCWCVCHCLDLEEHTPVERPLPVEVSEERGVLWDDPSADFQAAIRVAALATESEVP